MGKQTCAVCGVRAERKRLTPVTIRGHLLGRVCKGACEVAVRIVPLRDKQLNTVGYKLVPAWNERRE